MSRFTRIQNQRIYEQIVDQISQMIRDGALKPGDRLPAERQLAMEFGVSRAAVREALSALGMMGFLDVRQGDGTFIRAMPAETLVSPMALAMAIEAEEAVGWELLELRVAMESETAYLAALRREPEDLAALEAALGDMKRLLGESERADADFRFHRAVAEAAGNSLMIQTMQTLTEKMLESLRGYRTRLSRIPQMEEALYNDHKAVLDAIRSQDAAAAHDLMRAHIERVKGTLYGDPPDGAASFRRVRE